MAILAITTQLLEGTLNGPRVVYSGSRMCKMFVSPRDVILDVAAKQIPHQHGLYILIGKTEQGDPKAYVGQTKDFQQRVRDHLAKKEFWDTAIVFISKADEIYSSEVLYLEYLGIQKAIEAGAYNMDENAQIPPEPSLAPEKKIEMEQFFEEIQFFLKFYGCPIFEKPARKKRVSKIPKSIPASPSIIIPAPSHSPEIIQEQEYKEFSFGLKKAGMEAKLRYYPKDSRYIVLAGSLIAALNAPSLQPSIATFRNTIFSDSSLSAKKGEVYQLLKDIEMPGGSASFAAKFCAGTSRNGKTDWVDSDGHTIGEYATA